MKLKMCKHKIEKKMIIENFSTFGKLRKAYFIIDECKECGKIIGIKRAEKKIDGLKIKEM